MPAIINNIPCSQESSRHVANAHTLLVGCLRSIDYFLLPEILSPSKRVRLEVSSILATHSGVLCVDRSLRRQSPNRVCPGKATTPSTQGFCCLSKILLTFIKHLQNWICIEYLQVLGRWDGLACLGDLGSQQEPFPLSCPPHFYFPKSLSHWLS